MDSTLRNLIQLRPGDVSTSAQDNPLFHMARQTTQTFTDTNASVMPWLAECPDLNSVKQKYPRAIVHTNFGNLL